MTSGAPAVTLRPATDDDCRRIFDWQTAPGMRRYFHNPDPPTWPDHQNWFGETLRRPDRLLLMVALAGGAPVGLVRLDCTSDRDIDVSILIAREAQGHGVGVAALRVLRRIAPFADLLAEVYAANEKSSRIFQAAGFLGPAPGGAGLEYYRYPAARNEAGIALAANLGPACGLGHLTRSATLAHGLRRLGASPVLFLPEAPAGPGLSLTQGLTIVSGPFSGAALALLSCGAGAVVLDHYDLSPAPFLPAFAGRIFVFDDFDFYNEREDVIVVNGAARALSKLSQAQEGWALIGPAYQILRHDLPPPACSNPDQRPKRLLCALGGNDPLGIAQDMVDVLSAWAIRQDIAVDFVRGLFAGDPEPRPGVTLHQPGPSLSALISQADMGLTAGGLTLIEFLACGLPAVGLMTADNQARNLAALVERGLCLAGGDARKADWRQTLTSCLDQLAGDGALRNRLSVAGPEIFDGSGANRLAGEIIRRAKGAIFP